MSEQQQSNLPEINDQDLKKIESHTKWSLGIAGAVICLAFTAYFLKFGGGSFSSEGGTWGTFGDYIGGILNPTIAALALYWLVNSIKLQITELRETNKALNKTVETAKKQQDQVSLQNFENLFFQLLSTLTNITNEIQAGTSSTFLKLIDSERLKERNSKDSINFYLQKFSTINRPAQKGKESIKDQIIFFKVFVNHPWEFYYNKAVDDYFGSYFRTSYQIIKLIDKSVALLSLKENDMDLFSKEQKKYFDIFRAQLSGYELEAIFFNCLSPHGNRRFKQLIEKYGLFAHLLLDHERVLIDTDPDLKVINRLTGYAYRYERTVFEDNRGWNKYCDDLESLSENDYDEINQYIDLIVSDGIISREYFYEQNNIEFIENRIIIKPNQYIVSINLTQRDIKNSIRKIKENRIIINDLINQEFIDSERIDVIKIDIERYFGYISKDWEKRKNCQEKLKKYQSLNYFRELVIILKYKINFNEYSEFKRNQNSHTSS